MMKQLIFAFMMMFPVAVSAQDNSWERTTETQEEKNAVDQKYLAGAVPVVDNHVMFTTTIEAPGKTAAQVYDICKDYMTRMLKEPNQLEQSRLVITDPDKGQLVANIQEWLVFKSTALVLDRTRFMYHLMVDCADGQAKVTMTRIYYYYEEERNPTTFVAEEWITDRFGLNKKQNKLARVSGKFRRKTIDRKDFLFNKFASLLK